MFLHKQCSSLKKKSYFHMQLLVPKHIPEIRSSNYPLSINNHGLRSTDTSTSLTYLCLTRVRYGHDKILSRHMSNTPKHVSNIFVTFVLLGHVVDTLEQAGNTLGSWDT